MGCLEAAYCLDCVEYFSLKSSYMIGYPSLSEESEPNPNAYDESSVGDKVNFGFLKKGLSPLKMNTFDMVSYSAFLNKHKNHRMYLFNDHADDFPKEILDDNGEFLDKIDEFKYEDDVFVEGFYEIHCKTCNSTTRLDHEVPLKILPFEHFNITKEIIELVDNYSLLGESKSFDNYVWAFDLFLEEKNIFNFNMFLDVHSGHELIVRLSNDLSAKKIVDSDQLRKEINAKYPEKQPAQKSSGIKLIVENSKFYFRIFKEIENEKDAPRIAKIIAKLIVSPKIIQLICKDIVRELINLGSGKGKNTTIQ